MLNANGGTSFRPVRKLRRAYGALLRRMVVSRAETSLPPGDPLSTRTRPEEGTGPLKPASPDPIPTFFPLRQKDFGHPASNP
jgi:hypothetical protein